MTDQTTTLGAMATAKSALDARLDRIDEAHGSWRGAVGEWSVAELLQHMDGWLAEMTAAVERMIAGQRPTQAGVDYSDPDVWNPKFVSQRGEQSYIQTRADFDRSHETFTAAVGKLSADRFGEGKTINRIVEGVVTHHYPEHCEDLDRFLSGEH